MMPLSVLSSAPAADRRLADGELVFVHDRIGRVHEGVRLSGIGDRPGFDPVRVVRALGPLGLEIDLFHLPGLVVGARDDGDPRPVGAAVAGMRGHGRAVRGGEPADEDARAIVEDGVRRGRGAGRRSRGDAPAEDDQDGETREAGERARFHGSSAGHFLSDLRYVSYHSIIRRYMSARSSFEFGPPWAPPWYLSQTHFFPRRRRAVKISWDWSASTLGS